ncbi:MAG: hypothetical protein IRY92_10185, partial [Dactylosporangium sp.]|nr:hypothetical protein [Dactylosporangium sp.]
MPYQPLLDEEPLAQLARALRGGANHGDLPKPLGEREAAMEARAIVDDLLAQEEYPRLVERHGLRFFCYLEEEWEWGCPGIIHVQRWDGRMWRNVGEVRAAPAGRARRRAAARTDTTRRAS